MPKEPGLPAITEEIIDDIVQDLANDIEFITDSFMPDGKKFRQDNMTEDEQLDAYLQMGLHDSQPAAENFIRMGVVKLTGKLASYGIPQEMWASAHPYDIASAALYKLSYRMENLLKEREAKTALSPLVSVDGDEADGPTGRRTY